MRNHHSFQFRMDDIRFVLQRILQCSVNDAPVKLSESTLINCIRLDQLDPEAKLKYALAVSRNGLKTAG